MANVLLGVLTLAVMAMVAYAYLREGMFTAFTMTVNVFVAGLVAVNFFEPLAAGLGDAFGNSFLRGYEDALALVPLFLLTLGLLRWGTNSLARVEVQYHAQLSRVGGVLFGLVTGYLVAGFLLCVLQTLPWHENFLGFEAKIEGEGAPNPLRQVLPPDRVWLALMQRASDSALDRGQPFDRDCDFELRYARSRRYGDNRPPRPYPPRPPEEKGAPAGPNP